MTPRLAPKRDISESGFRGSFGFRFSGFGFRVRGLRASSFRFQDCGSRCRGERPTLQSASLSSVVSSLAFRV